MPPDAITTIDKAAAIIRAGGVIAYPTEGVWGLGCDPFNKEAVYRVLALKQRPVEKGLILVAADMGQVGSLASELPAQYRELLAQTWPGPNTWLLPDTDQRIPDWIRGQFTTVAVRVSAHPLVKALCERVGGMIVSTSANPADASPALTQAEVAAYFPEGLDAILPGELGGQQGPSTIRDLMSQQLVR